MKKLNLEYQRSQFLLKGVIFTAIATFIFGSRPSFSGELHNAAVFADLSEVQELISKGQNIEALDSDPSSEYEFPKGTALHWAARAGNESVVRYLITSGANLDALTDAGVSLMVETPLDYAVWYNHKNIVLMLLAAGANVESAGHVFHWPLQAAVSMGAIDLAETMLKYGADLNRTGVDGYTALHHAIFDNQKESIDFLLSKGADPNYRDIEFGEAAQTPLQLAQKQGAKEIVELLIKYGAE
jgi:ankyrin repeat protein